jgi:hypothetical protein
MRIKSLVKLIKEVAREKEEKRLKSHHSTKYKGNNFARNHPPQVKLAEKIKDEKKEDDSKDDDVDHRPDVVDTSPTLNTISQAR